MATHFHSTLRRRAKVALVAALCAALLAPGAAEAGSRQFSSGSLIIPASIDYQTDDGVLGTYAMVYLALHLNAKRATLGKKKITFYWAVQPTKLSHYRCDTATEALPSYGKFNDNDGCDFAVQIDSGPAVSQVESDNTLKDSFPIYKITYLPTLGPTRVCKTWPVWKCSLSDRVEIKPATKVVKFLGGVWIVDAVDRQDFLDMLATEPQLARFHKNGDGSATYVNIYSANAAFRAPIVSTVADKPLRIAAVGGNEYQFTQNVLVNSGLCQPDTLPLTPTSATPGCVGTFVNGAFESGVVLDYYADPADLLDAKGSFATGRLNGSVNGEKYGAFWAADGATLFDTARLGNLATFLDKKGNTAYVQYDAIWSVENTFAANQTAATATDFQTTKGVLDYNPNVASLEDCNDATLPPPPASKFGSTGGDCLVLGGANQPWAQTGNFVFDGGQGNFKAYQLATGSALNTGVTKVAQVKGGPIVSSGYYKDDDTEKGLLLYLAGHKFDNDRFWGERLLLNTLFSHLSESYPELARSEPVGYQNKRVSPNTTRVYQGTYVQKPLPSSNDILTYNAAAADKWKFPFTEGHLYEYDIGAIKTATDTDPTGGSFSATAKKWDAGAIGSTDPATMLPLPGERRIYTYVGGSANLGWKRIEFKHTEVGAACTDADANQKCDLGELLALGNSAGVTTAALADKGTDATQQGALGLLVSQVRGFCSAHSPKTTGTPILEPGDAQCDRSSAPNRAVLGGIDHSTPAVVGPSKYIADATYGARPVVLYAGGRDGMLHAFYVSPGGPDLGKTAWSADGESVPAGVTGGQELWAIVPPGQVPRLASNDAMVDGTINVVDVFGDFPYDRNGDGVIDWKETTDPKTDERPNGIRRWRTVLIASAAAPPSDAYGFRGGSELFALDVTNPLHPVLLWYLDGPVNADDRFDLDKNGVFDAKETFDPTDPSTFALRWKDGPGVDYNTTDATTIEKMKSGRYDYRNLGLTYSTAVAKVWDGGAYKYILYAATNSVDWHRPAPLPDGTVPPYTPTGYRGAEIFAIDVIKGQKLWQWEHHYDTNAGAGVDNSIPPRMALGDIDANGSTERIYLGDMEGHLWELFSRDGRNVNFKLASDKAYHSFPLYGTIAMTGNDKTPPASDETKALYAVAGSKPARLSQQPLTTPIGQGRFTKAPKGLESYLVGRLGLVVGTMGVDWSIAPYEKGHLYVLPIYPDLGTRLDEPIDLTGTTRDPKLYGILKKEAAWDIELQVGERVYGMPRVVNNQILFNTAFGSFAGDLTENFNEPGNYREVATDSSKTSKNDAKSFGGVLVVGGQVVVSTDTTVKKKDAEKLGTEGVNAKTFNRATPAVMKSWESWEVTP